MNINQWLNKAKGHLNLNNGVLVVALLVAFSWVWSTIDAIQRNFKLQQQVDDLHQEIAVQDLKNKSAEFQNKYYASSEYQELSARERLNKASPGEKVLILPPNTVHSDDKVQVQAETPIAERSNFAQWMYFLFGKKG
jgi:cell division protein FtsB